MADVVKSVRLSPGLVSDLATRAASRSVEVSSLLRLGAAWAAQATDEELDRYLPPEPRHSLTLVADEQRKSGWHLAWRCERRDCDVRGNLTLGAGRWKAVELYELLVKAHDSMESA